MTTGSAPGSRPLYMLAISRLWNRKGVVVLGCALWVVILLGHPHGRALDIKEHTRPDPTPGRMSRELSSVSFECVSDLVFLGHKIRQEGVSPSEELVQMIQHIFPPSNKNSYVHCSFLSWGGYYRTYVPNFASIGVPLSDLTKRVYQTFLCGLKRKIKPSECWSNVFANHQFCVYLMLSYLQFSRLMHRVMELVPYCYRKRNIWNTLPLLRTRGYFPRAELLYYWAWSPCYCVGCSEIWELLSGYALLPGDGPSSSAVSSVSQVSKWSGDEVVLDFAAVSFHCPRN